MVFWAGLVAVVSLSVFAVRNQPIFVKRFVFAMLSILLIFISGFRLNIGNDYGSYVKMFYLYNLGTPESEIMQLGHEPTFNFLITAIYDAGFNEQALFLIYSIVTGFFLWLGLRQLKNSMFMLYGLALSVLELHMMWYFYSIIRQGVAMCIFLIAMQYIREQNFKKYLFWIFFASLWHFSAILLLPLYWIPQCRIKLRKYILIIVACVILERTGLMIGIIESIISAMNLGYAGYLANVDETGFHWFNLFMIMVTLFIIKNSDYAENKVVNILALYNVCGILFAWNGSLLRMTLYLEMALLLLLPPLIEKYRYKYRTGLVILAFFLPFAIFFLYQINGQSNVNAVLGPAKTVNNIEYEFNFELVERNLDT